MITPKQSRFVSEYLKDSNATQAAIRAGYSATSAGQMAHALLKKHEISAAVSKRAEQVGMSADDVLSAVAALAKSAEKDSDRLTALGMLGKYHRLFTDKLQVEAGASFADLVLSAQRLREGKNP